MWDLPRPGIEPVSPALAGGFSTTVPPRKSLRLNLYLFFLFFLKQFHLVVTISLTNKYTLDLLRTGIDNRINLLFILFFSVKDLNYFLISFYWCIVILQCCVIFYCTVKWSSLCYIACSCYLTILYILVYICQSQSPNSSHPLTPTFSPWCPYVCSLHLCLYFCLANWFIYTIFLDSTYMR